MKQIFAILLELGLSLALSFPGAAGAEPAPWYQWRSKATGSLVCSQTPLGAGWERFGGPYRDARCEKRKAAK
jgi:hypothetical protein